MKRKREWYKKLPKYDNNKAYVYKIATKEAKKTVSQARAQAL